MATTSEINKSIDEISASIDALRRQYESAKGNITRVATTLGDIPTQYSDVITSILAFGDTDSYEVFKKAELAKLTTEFTELQTLVSATVTAIG